MSDLGFKDYTELDHFLRFKCFEGTKRWGLEMNDDHMARIAFEGDIICKTRYATYFLIVADLCEFMRKQGIMYMVRGSGCGSEYVWRLGISNRRLNPMKYHLPFERFLNPHRISMPDLDIDIQDDRRDEVVQYTIDKYGKDRVAKIITFSTLAPKQAVTDVARAMGLPNYMDVIKPITAAIPGGKGVHLKEEIEKNAFLQEEERKNPDLFRLAMRLEGRLRNASVHAAGTIIAPDKMTKFLPLFFKGSPEDRSPEDWFPATQWDMYACEERGLLKMDYLGLKTLRVIDQTCKAIRAIKQAMGEDPSFEIDDIAMDDEKTWQLLADGKTAGVFQIEAGYVRGFARRMNLMRKDPWNLAILVAIIRPGMMDAGTTEQYLKRASGEEQSTPLHPLLAETFADTYGIMAFQEDVMRAAVDGAGFTMAEADVLRKGVGKKDKKFIDKQKPIFTEGFMQPRIEVVFVEKDGKEKRVVTKPRNPDLKALVAKSNYTAINTDGTLGACVMSPGPDFAPELKIKSCRNLMNGATKEETEKVWANIEAHARYSFNNAHAAAYGMCITYPTAFLKARWTLPFMTFLIDSESGTTSKEDGYNYKVAEYVEEARSMGIAVLSPCVKRSAINCKMVWHQQQIRFGLSLIKKVSVSAATWIKQHCVETNHFKDFVLSCFEIRRNGDGWGSYSRVSKSEFEALIHAGALDCFDPNRCRMLAMLEQVCKLASDYHKQCCKVKGGSKVRRTPEMIKQELDAFILEDDDIVEQLSLEQLLEKEREMTGCFLSKSPFEPYRDVIHSNCTCTPADIKEGNVNGKMVFVGMLTKVKEHTITKGKSVGKTMAFLGFTGINGDLEATCFAQTWNSLNSRKARDGTDIPFERSKVYLVQVKPDDRTGGLILMDAVRLSNFNFGG